MDDPSVRECTQQIVAGRAGELPAWLLDGMFRLRHEVFHERLRWDVHSLHGRERDSFDDCDPVYVISYAQRCREITGCCRLLPTEGPSQRLGDGKATRFGKLLCSAYTTSTRDFLENALPAPEGEPHCQNGRR